MNKDDMYIYAYLYQKYYGEKKFNEVFLSGLDFDIQLNIARLYEQGRQVDLNSLKDLEKETPSIQFHQSILLEEIEKELEENKHSFKIPLRNQITKNLEEQITAETALVKNAINAYIKKFNEGNIIKIIQEFIFDIFNENIDTILLTFEELGLSRAVDEISNYDDNINIKNTFPNIISKIMTINEDNEPFLYFNFCIKDFNTQYIRVKYEIFIFQTKEIVTFKENAKEILFYSDKSTFAQKISNSILKDQQRVTFFLSTPKSKDNPNTIEFLNQAANDNRVFLGLKKTG